MKLKSITLENFRSFSGTHTLEFLEEAVVFVQGINTDNGIESATGKSSLLLAISYALGIAPFSQKDLQNWNTVNPMQVSLVVDFDGQLCTIVRGKSTRIETPDATITGAKDIDAFLVKKTGLSNVQLSFVLYKNQGANSYFLDKTNSEKRDFLSTVLGLERFEEEIVKDNSSIGQLRDQELRLQATGEAFVFQKISLEKDITDLVIPVQPAPVNDKDVLKHTTLVSHAEEIFKAASVIYQENIAELKNEELDLKQRFASTQASKTTERLTDELKNNIENYVIPAYERFVVSAQKTVREQEDAVKVAIQQEKQRQQVIQEIALLQEALAKLKNGSCPTCEQPWTAEAKIQEYEKKIDELQLLAAQPDNTSVCHATLATSRSELKTQEDTLKWQRNNRLVVKTNLEESIAKDKSSFLVDLGIISDKIQMASDALTVHKKGLSDAQVQYSKAKAILDGQVKEVELYCTKFAQLAEKKEFLTKKIQETQESINKNDSALFELEKQIAYHKDKVDFIKGFLTFIFSDVLEEIANETNTYIATIPNVEGIAIAFEQEKLTQKGTTKNEVVTLIKINGEPRSLQSGCSGGQQAALRLATELAVRNVLQRRVGKFWGFMMIDEQFTGLDLISKAACLQILQDFSKKHLILAIDHHSEIAASAMETIKITYSQGNSSFV